MLKRLITWFVIFALSFVVAATGLISQGLAFLALFSFVILFKSKRLAIDMKDQFKPFGNLSTLLMDINILFATFVVWGSYMLIAWLIVTLFHIDFFIAFEIVAWVMYVPNKDKLKNLIKKNR